MLVQQVGRIGSVPDANNYELVSLIHFLHPPKKKEVNVSSPTSDLVVEGTNQKQ